MTDLAEFSARFDEQLVWVEDDPAGAATQYRSRLVHNPYGGDGLVQLSYHGRQMIAPELWDDVDGIWAALVSVIEDYLVTGTGRSEYPGQPVPVSLIRDQRSISFSVGDQVSWVDPTDFVPSLLDGAERHFSWLSEHVGRPQPEMSQRISVLRTKLPYAAGSR